MSNSYYDEADHILEAAEQAYGINEAIAKVKIWMQSYGQDEREAAALEAVRVAIPGARYRPDPDRRAHRPVLELFAGCFLAAYDGVDEYYLYPSNVGYWRPRHLRAVLRALDILNGVDE